MRDTVADAFFDMTVEFEGGYITWMFPDVKGLVSTGFGLLLDPVALSIALPWRRSDGSLASRDEIIADWANVKNFPDAARLGHKAVEHVAKLRLDRDGLYRAFKDKLAQNDEYIRHRFPTFEEWPSDAILGMHSMAWACGPGAWDAANPEGFPKMAAALTARDFSAAAAECHMDEHKGGVFNVGLVPRNAANKVLFRNAATVVAGGMDPNVLHWPKSLADEVTQPHIELPVTVRDPVVAERTFEVVYGLPPLESPDLDEDPPPSAA